VVRLLEAFGVAPARLSAVGYGAARPSTVPGAQRDPQADDRVVIVATR
jgi:outer membrane protein OmpA-like peptidoglycan-associated protein